jgi:IclR family pca regulon transcriptional regulator
VPIFGRADAPVAAINIAVSSSRHDVQSLRSVLLPRLQEAAADISMRLKAL